MPWAFDQAPCILTSGDDHQQKKSHYTGNCNLNTKENQYHENTKSLKHKRWQMKPSQYDKGGGYVKTLVLNNLRKRVNNILNEI